MIYDLRMVKAQKSPRIPCGTRGRMIHCWLNCFQS